MHCKHCGADLDKKQTICPECGVQVNEEMTAAVPQQMEDFSVALPDGDYDDFKKSEEAEDPSVSKKKKNLGLIAAIVVLCVVAVVAAVLFLGRDKSPYTGPMASDQYIVAEYKDHKLTNQMFMYYYWGQFYELYENYGTNLSYLGLDVNKPFENQKFGDEDRTWADFFTDYAIQQWVSDMAFSDAMQMDGFALTADQQAALQKGLDNLDAEAQQYGYKDAETYLKTAFDLSVDVPSYQAYTTTTYTTRMYLSSKYDVLLTAGKADPGNHTDVHYIHIRHVLIKFADNTDASKAAAKTEAQSLYDSFKKDPTKDNFIALAKEHSDDGSASAGGLIENVYPGQMVTNFNDWCFAAGRKAGDYGLVETEYGWHLMFFEGTADKVYRTAAESYANAEFDAWESALLKDIKHTESREKITFRHPKR